VVAPGGLSPAPVYRGRMSETAPEDPSYAPLRNAPADPDDPPAEPDELLNPA